MGERAKTGENISWLGSCGERADRADEGTCGEWRKNKNVVLRCI